MIPAAAIVAAALMSSIQAIPTLAGGGGCHGGLPFTDAAVTSVDLAQNCFGPTVARVERGKTVVFRNNDPYDHMVSGANATFGTFDALRPGKSVAYRFDNDGVYPYFCMMHPGMTGAVVVGTGQPGPGGPAGGVTRVQPAAAVAASAPAKPQAPAAPPWPLLGLAAVAFIATGFAAGRWVAPR
jgi:plastocyanin